MLHSPVADASGLAAERVTNCDVFVRRGKFG